MASKNVIRGGWLVNSSGGGQRRVPIAIEIAVAHLLWRTLKACEGVAPSSREREGTGDPWLRSGATDDPRETWLHWSRRLYGVRITGKCLQIWRLEAGELLIFHILSSPVSVLCIFLHAATSDYTILLGPLRSTICRSSIICCLYCVVLFCSAASSSIVNY